MSRLMLFTDLELDAIQTAVERVQNDPYYEDRWASVLEKSASALHGPDTHATPQPFGQGRGVEPRRP